MAHTHAQTKAQAQTQAQTHRHRHPDTQTLKHPDTNKPRYLYTHNSQTHTHTSAQIAAERAESYRDVNFEVLASATECCIHMSIQSHMHESAMQKRETLGDAEGALNSGKTHSERHMVDTCCDASSLRSCLASCETGHDSQTTHLHSLVPSKVRQCQ